MELRPYQQEAVDAVYRHLRDHDDNPCIVIPADGDGMYRSLLANMRVINPLVRVIGLTATPFRMKSEMICAPENFLNAICYEVGVKEGKKSRERLEARKRRGWAKVYTK